MMLKELAYYKAVKIYFTTFAASFSLKTPSYPLEIISSNNSTP